jgi:uncharacterized membrane protein
LPTVSAEARIGAPVAAVYALARDIEAFPQFMEDVQEVTILEQTADRQVSHWVGVIKEFGRTIAWTEEDFWSEADHSCFFRQTEGDFTSYMGTWRFEEADGGTVARLEVTYEYRVPLVGALIQGLLQKKVQRNCQAMLDALKRKAEGAA